MDLHLSREQETLRKMYHDFAEDGAKSLVERVGKNEALPEETVREMVKLGAMGIYFPKEYGGTGADAPSYVIAVEETSKVCDTTGIITSARTFLCYAPIYENGTEKQKRYYLPKLCSGKWIGAFGLTGPGTGTDAQGQQTTAVLDEKGESWIPDGSKIFITDAGYTDIFMIFAITDVTTDKCSHKKKGISVFIVERTDPDFSVGKHEEKMGIKDSSICELITKGCITPRNHLLGKQGKDFGIAMKTLDGGRIGIASQALGLAEGAIKGTIKCIKERVQFGRRISQLQDIRFQLTDMHAKTEAAKWLVYSVTVKKENHKPHTVGAAMAKLVAAETASDVTCRCIQLSSDYGYTHECLMERMMYDTRVTGIYEGTNEVQRMVVSADLGAN